MSIRTIQISSVIEEITSSYFASGVNPTFNQILNKVSEYFAKYPAGQALGIPSNLIASGDTANSKDLNFIFAHIAMNIELLYQSCLEQTAQNLSLTQNLASSLNRLTTRQQNLSKKIDYHMQSIYNSSSYYYSISDNFADTSQTDLSFTSAFVDTSGNGVIIPTIGSLSKVVDPTQIGVPSYGATIGGASVSYQTISPLSFSTNGLSNTVWEVQVTTQVPSEVVFAITLPISNGNNITLSQINFTPYGVTPVQVYLQVGTPPLAGAPANSINFGGDVQTGTNLMKFINGSPIEVNSIQIFLHKTQADYVSSAGGVTNYKYIFGASDIMMLENVYDDQATFVSSPLSIHPDLSNDMVIDAVSLVVNSQLPPITDITYSIAQDPGNAIQLSDFNWQTITPVGSQSNNNSVIQFNGAVAYSKYIEDTPGDNSLQLIPLNNTNNNLSLQNPTSTIIPGVDVYTISNFSDTPLLNSITLEEGINSTKIYYIDYGSLDRYSSNPSIPDLDDANTSTFNDEDMEAWGNIIANQSSISNLKIIYGNINDGNGFFYGGNIGENGVSILIETYVNLDKPIQPIVDYLQKTDASSQTWDVRAYLNGDPIGWLPGRNIIQSETPIDRLLVPWNLNQGLNCIHLLINIPPLNLVNGNISPYSGTLQLMQNHDLYQFGTVKLADWNYVDFFDLQYNTVGTPKTFTIYNGQIITRRQPTTNYRLSYKIANGKTVEAIRLRADLSRNPDNPYVTPQLTNYQLRFLYGNNN